MSTNGNSDVLLAQKLIFDGQKLTKENKTILTEQQKLEISNKIKVITDTKYNEVMSKYNEQTTKIEDMLKALQMKIVELDN